MLSGFGPKGPGQRNDGVNIAATTGEDVHAAASGEVVFAGDLPDFGKLVLLKHPGGWVTAYAHLSKIAVKMRDAVAQGQPLGEVGQTGAVDRPQLHFEIRYAANPARQGAAGRSVAYAAVELERVRRSVKRPRRPGRASQGSSASAPSRPANSGRSGVARHLR